MAAQPEHLGDGVYISPDGFRGAFVLTANHHDPALATDKVYLDTYVIKALLDYLNRNADK